MRSLMTLALATLLLVTTNAALAQSKVPVYLSSTVDDDQVGQQFVFELKEAIRGSGGFKLIEDVKQMPYIKVSVVTISTSTVSTAASVSMIYDSLFMPAGGAYITSVVQVCGRQQVASCARGILANIDAAVDGLQRIAPELRKTLR